MLSSLMNLTARALKAFFPTIFFSTLRFEYKNFQSSWKATGDPFLHELEKNYASLEANSIGHWKRPSNAFSQNSSCIYNSIL